MHFTGLCFLILAQASKVAKNGRELIAAAVLGWASRKKLAPIPNFLGGCVQAVATAFAAAESPQLLKLFTGVFYEN